MTTSVSITDTRFTIETPEGADLPLEPVGMGARIMAFMIDWLIKTGCSIVVLIVLAFAGEAGMGIFLIFYFLLEWFYPVFFEVFVKGQTPGKMTFRIRVVSEDGTPLTFGASLLRNLLRVVDFLPFSYLAGVICSLSNPRFQRIGDIVAGTMVVYIADPVRKPKIDISGVEALPAEMSTDEQRSMVNFAERCSHLSQGRQEELAEILAPILGSGDRVSKIKRMAKGIVEQGDQGE